MTVRWTPIGLRDLESLHAFVAEYSAHASEAAAANIVERILAGLSAIERFPGMAGKSA
jgi:plasmid stabilization system protein ParE